MKLRQRILLVIGATVLSLICGIYLLSKNLLLSNYIELEKRESERNVARVVDGLNGQIEDMHASALDWSNWDESFRFVSDQNQKYIDSNLATMTLKLDLLLFLDSNGKAVHARPVSRTDGIPAPTTEQVRDALGLTEEKPDWDPYRQIKGLAFLGGRLAMLSVRPVTPTENNKPPNGWMVWVLYFGEAEARSLARRTHLKYEARSAHDSGLQPDAKSILPLLNPSQNLLSKPLNSQQVVGYGLLNDISGTNPVVVRVLEPRLIYAQGVSSTRQLVLGIVMVALLFGAISFWLLDRFALSRLAVLSQQVDRLSEKDRWQNRIQLPGRDEISQLASNINQMVVNLREGREELSSNNERLQDTVSKLASANSILEHAVEGIARMNADGAIISTNVSFAENLGYVRGDLEGHHWETLVHGADQERFFDAMEDVRTIGKETVEVQAVRKDKSLFHAEISIVRSDRPGGRSEGFHLFMKDITERKWLETKIEHQAYHDPLTGLANRARFLEGLAHAIARAKRRHTGVAVIFMDLDNFKIINDSLGHQAGDELLIQIAGRLQTFIREEDMIARLGGDEFTILLQDLESVDRAVEVTERLVMALSEPIQMSHGETVAMASIGIAYSESGSAAAESLLRDADTAMYAAKARGKSGYAIFDQSMNEVVVERLELENGLRQALDQGEFSLEYQPIVSLTSGNITGIEALLRWNHPTNGRIPPDKFIPVAEESGLIVPIGAWVLREACSHHMQLIESRPHCKSLSLSVNLSGRQLQRADTVKIIRDVLEETNFDPTLLKLEVTESVLIRDEVESVGRLHELKALGIQIAIDDFGTGYSSLSTLNSYPVDVVKIDREFICRMGQEEEVDAIVGAIVLLSRVMHLEVTAEGLETREQVQYLQAFGCDSAQGFYFSKPLAWHALLGLFDQGLNLSNKLEDQQKHTQASMLAA